MAKLDIHVYVIQGILDDTVIHQLTDVEQEIFVRIKEFALAHYKRRYALVLTIMVGKRVKCIMV